MEQFVVCRYRRHRDGEIEQEEKWPVRAWLTFPDQDGMGRHEESSAKAIR